MAFLFLAACVTLLVVGISLHAFDDWRVQRAGDLLGGTALALLVIGAFAALWLATAVEMGWISAAQLDVFF